MILKNKQTKSNKRMGRSKYLLILSKKKSILFTDNTYWKSFKLLFVILSGHMVHQKP